MTLLTLLTRGHFQSRRQTGGVFFKRGRGSTKPPPALFPHEGNFEKSKLLRNFVGYKDLALRWCYLQDKKMRWQRQEERANLFDNAGFSFFDEDAEDEQEEARPRGSARRRTKECETLSKDYVYRRAYSEQSLLEAMSYEPLKAGRVYWFITQGDCDAMSYLKIAMNGRHIERVIISSWVIAAEDVLQLAQWVDEGRIDTMDIYVGDVFPGQYKVEYGMLKDLYNKHPDLGRLVSFKNHSKIVAIKNESEDFWYCACSSANINTNPRTEQGVVCLDKSLYRFYEGFFNSIEK